MKQWGPRLFAKLAHLLNMVEETGRWPEGTTEAKAAFLEKDPEDSGNPLAYRVLLILPGVYRRWAGLRLTQLADWIDQWAPPEMFAGIRGRGAEDGWLETGFFMEQAAMEGQDYTAGAVDIMKCFDQLQRPLIYALAKKAGMPDNVLNTYRVYQEGLTARNAVAGGLGEPYAKPTSIPQGDPLSMAIVGLIMTPWVNMMKARGLKPRVLADDIFLIAKGEEHRANFEQGFEETQVYPGYGGETGAEEVAHDVDL